MLDMPFPSELVAVFLDGPGRGGQEVWLRLLLLDNLRLGNVLGQLPEEPTSVYQLMPPLKRHLAGNHLVAIQRNIGKALITCCYQSARLHKQMC